MQERRVSEAVKRSRIDATGRELCHCRVTKSKAEKKRYRIGVDEGKERMMKTKEKDSTEIRQSGKGEMAKYSNGSKAVAERIKNSGKEGWRN